MIGNSINLSLKNIWRSWFAFRMGKYASPELHEFQYDLEKNLFELHRDLNSGRYRHGQYRKFIVCDNKRREISVAPIRDRVAHRLVYDYLVGIHDKTFIFDAWSCRKGKGLLACIERAHGFLRRFPKAFIWRADVRKFFDSVDQRVLLEILSRRVKNSVAMRTIESILASFSVIKQGGGRAYRYPHREPDQPDLCQYLSERA